MKRIIATIFILSNLALTVKSHAQHELALHFLDTVWQSSYTNPAYRLAGGRSSYMMPSMSFNYKSPNAPSQLTVENEGKRTLNAKAAFNNLEPVSHLYTNLDIQTLGLTLGFKKFALSFHNSLKGNVHLNVSKDLIGGFAFGNNSYLGKTMDLSVGLNAQLYSELGMNLAFKVSDKISIGLRAKRLSGIANISTVKQKLTLLTDSVDYKLTFTSDFDVQTNGINDFKKFSDGTFNFRDVFMSQNSGLSFDVGTTVQLGKLRIDASVIDLMGAINWKKDAHSYSSNGTYEYSGQKSDKFLSFEGLNQKDVQDTLKEALNVKESTTGLNTTKLPLKTYVGATYDFTEKIKFGALIYTETWDGATKFDVAINSTFKLTRAIQLGATYSMRYGRFDNLGLHFVLNVGPIQLYGVTDNIVAVFNSYNSKSMNGRMGLNFLFN